MKPDLGIDIEGLDPEVARAYGLTTPNQGSPSIAVTLIRAIGWLGISLWLGGLVVIQMVVAPQITTTMSFLPLRRHTDWQPRAVAYTVGGSLGTVSMVAIVVFVFPIMLGILEMRMDSFRRVASRISLIVTAALGAALVYSLNLRFDLINSTPDRFTNISATYNQFVDLQIGLLIVLTFALAWTQSINTSNPTA